MPNDYINALNNLREATISVNSMERAYNILLECKGKSMHGIQQYLMGKLQDIELDDDVKYFLTWALTNIIAGLSESEYNISVDGMQTIITNQKAEIESGLLSLFNAMVCSGLPLYVDVANGFLSKMNETSLYHQLLDGEELLRDLVSEVPDGESFPGRGH